MTLKTQRFLLGALAGMMALALAMRIIGGAVFLPELAAQTVFSLASGEQEATAVRILGTLAKPLTIVLALLVNIALYGFLGTLFPRTPRGGTKRRSVLALLQLFVFPYLILASLAALLLQTTEIQTLLITLPALALQLLPPQLAFGLTLLGISHPITAPSTAAPPTIHSELNVDARRRLILRTTIAGTAASVALFLGVSFLLRRPPSAPELPSPPSPSPASSNEQLLAILQAAEVTPNPRFYRVDLNFLPPTVDAESWRLTVKGLVKTPSSFSYPDIQSMDAVEQHNTLECISNPIGGDLISTAQWEGVPLKTLLDKVGVDPQATYIVFRCRDGYDVGIPLERGLRDGTLLAYTMNGVPLPPDHGFPLRALIPGVYGMMNAKWITEIELVKDTHEGFWQRRGWSNTAEYQTHSFTAFPGDALKERIAASTSTDLKAGQETLLGGVAFAGDRGIARVELSTDGGITWNDASVKSPLSGFTWTLWTYVWRPEASGTPRILVRATDARGALQRSETQDSFPNGATGYHQITVRVQPTAPDA